MATMWLVIWFGFNLIIDRVAIHKLKNKKEDALHWAFVTIGSWFLLVVSSVRNLMAD